MHLIKHAAQIGKNCATNGKAIAYADRRSISILSLRLDRLCILRQSGLPAAELLLEMLHVRAEGFSAGEIAALSCGRQAQVSRNGCQDAPYLFERPGIVECPGLLLHHL